MSKNVKIMIKLKWLILVFIITTAISCKSKNEKINNSNAPTPVKVVVKKVTKNIANNLFTYTGNVIPKITTPLSFILPGTVQHIFIDEGDWVKKGQILAQINNASYQGAYQGTSATLEQAKDAYNRLKIVYDRGSLPAIKWKDAIAKLGQAKSANQIALQNLRNTSLRAPLNGYISSRNLEIGQTTIPGNTVFKIVSLNELYVKISVSENEIGKIKKGQMATIVIPSLGSQVFKGIVEKIGIVANAVSKTYDVKILIKNPKLIIKPGMDGDVTINTKSNHAIITIPYRSITKNTSGNYYVYIVNPKSKIAIKKQIEIGGFINNNVEIKSGISLGDLIVTDGKQKLANNQKVTY